jgi:hypothetical protein
MLDERFPCPKGSLVTPTGGVEVVRLMERRAR